MVPIAAFRRCGTHALAALLYRNLLIPGAESYEDLHYSHSRVPDVDFVAVHRPVLPTMVSFWRMRRRFGVECTFARMLREPFDELKKAEDCDVEFDGARVIGAHQLDIDEPLPMRWLRDCCRFCGSAKICIPYGTVSTHPLQVIESVQDAFNLARRGPFVHAFDRIGWVPKGSEEPDVSWDDLRLLESYQQQFTSEQVSRLLG